MISGRVVKYTKDRGFGFVRPDDGGQDVFLHIAELKEAADARSLHVGQVVTFRREEGDRGPKAVEVVIGKPGAVRAAEDDGMSDVLTAVEFHGEIDGLLDLVLRKAKQQIQQEMVAIGRAHGWVDD